LRLREFIVERITVIKFGVNDRGSNGTGISGIEVRPDTVKLTNVIVVINCFWSFSSCNNRHVVSTALWELI